MGPLKVYRFSGVAAIILALSPPIGCALLARHTGRWDLFERSGAITTAIGLLLASRRYVRYGVLELVKLHVHELEPDHHEILHDMSTAKLGLALSAFGTIIWGWGQYLGWWSFSYVFVWIWFALRDYRRDVKHTPVGLSIARHVEHDSR